MKQPYKLFSRLLFAIFFIVAGTQSAKACHGTSLVGLTFTPTATGINIDANSDAATCGCGPYYLQAEVAFTSPCLTGNSPACSSSSWNTFPWYFSGLNVPGYGPPSYTENCVLEPYFTLTIPFSDLCAGTSYVIRVREFVCGSASAGPWMSIYTFTTPGVPIPVVVSTTSDRYTACPGDTVHLNATATGGCPGSVFSYSWAPAAGLSNPNIANPTLTVPTTNTVYTLTITGQCGNPFTATDDTVGITIGPPPISGSATAAPTSVCSGGSSTITLTGQDPASTIQWEVSPNGVTWFVLPGANSTTYNTGPLTSTLYYHAIIYGSGWWPGSGCGSVTSTPVMVTVNPSPAANAGSNQVVCVGSCANLTGTGGVSYTWQPGNLNGANQTVCPGSNTTYTLTVTDNNGCTATDNVVVNLSTATVTASPDVSICTGNNTILLATGPNGNSYSWSPSGTLTGATTANPSASPSTTTTYTVTATNGIGCTAVDSVVVTVTTAAPIVVSNDTTLCAGGNATLSASGASSYTWQPGNLSGSSVTVNVLTTSTYVVTGNTNNCLSVDTVVVNVNPIPAVFAGPDFGVCAGSQVTMSVAANGNSYSWAPASGIIGSSNSQSVVAQPTTNTSYTITVTGVGGCISTDTINVSINPVPTVTATTTDNTICIGSSTTLNAAGATSYQWIPAVGILSPTTSSTSANPVNTTTYQVVGTNANGCMDTASITITVNPLPNVWMIPTPTECGDTTGTITLGGVVSGTGPFTYTVNSQTYNSLPINNLLGGNYNVTITDANGCITNEPVSIGTVNGSFVSAAANPTFGVHPLPVGFTATGSSGLNNWHWDFGDGMGQASTQSANYTYNNTGIYQVVILAFNDLYGCYVTDTISVEVVEQAIVTLPNVFTPNADGTNDGFAATISGVKEMKVEIYNRWGGRVYEGTQGGLSGGPQDLILWDGKASSGNVCEDGVYYYVVTALGYDLKNYDYSGFVHILK